MVYRARSFFSSHFFSVVTATTIALVVWSGFYFHTRAAIGLNSSSGLVQPGLSIKASSATTSVIGLNIATSAETLASIRLSINPFGGFSTTTDLAALGTATSSGIALYRDSKVAGIFGQFDLADTVVPLTSVPAWTGATTTLTFAAPEAVPADNTTGANVGNDFFIVIRTASGVVSGRSVSFNLYPGEIGYSANTPSATPAALTTNLITTDSSAPTISAIGPRMLLLVFQLARSSVSCLMRAWTFRRSTTQRSHLPQVEIL